MRKIEKQMIDAIRRKEPFKQGNTAVVQEKNLSLVYLHGSNIATVNHTTMEITFSFCGYNTRTTASRIRALGVPVGFRDFEPVLYEKVKQKNWSVLCPYGTYTVPDIEGINRFL